MLQQILLDYTKSRLLLDFSRGAQRVSPVCVVVLLGSDGEGASKWPSLHTAETAMRPFSAAKSNFKGTMVLEVTMERLCKGAPAKA